MCGRLNITDDPFSQLVSEILGIRFWAPANADLRPGEMVNVVSGDGGTAQQLPLNWGIKPDWAKRLIINAQAETVEVKPTFRQAFAMRRVLVPCAGWYEWTGHTGCKQKYLFSHPEGQPLFIAGIALGDNLVSLTTKPTTQCAQFHHRMPLLIPNDGLLLWLQRDKNQATGLLEERYGSDLLVSSC